MYINHNIAIPNILRIHTVLCSQYNLSSDALYKYTIYRYPIKLNYPATSYGTVRYRTMAVYIAIHISAILQACICILSALAQYPVLPTISLSL